MVWIQNLTTKFLEADFKYFWYSKSHCYRETALNIHRLVVKDFLNLEVKDFLNLVVKDFLNFNFFRVFFPITSWPPHLTCPQRVMQKPHFFLNFPFLVIVYYRKKAYVLHTQDSKVSLVLEYRV